jgi:hypothetical protein
METLHSHHTASQSLIKKKEMLTTLIVTEDVKDFLMFKLVSCGYLVKKTIKENCIRKSIFNIFKK